MIKSKEEIETRGIEIDLTGPRGNAFFLLGTASNLAKQLDYSKKEIQELLEEMKGSDYEYLINIFEDHFGQFVTLYR